MVSTDRPRDERPQPGSRRILAALEAFYAAPLASFEASRAEREAHLLALFRAAAEEVPAYRDFLAKRAVEPATVRTLEQFCALPPTTKQNYHQAYPLAELCRHGRLEDCDMLAVSSGSTGEPTLWPRSVADELGTARRFEQVLTGTFGADRRKTLGVVCFALGSWVGGMYTTAACRHLAAKGYPLTLVTPGSNLQEILRVVGAAGPLFEQIVLFGYPPFLKDVLDAGARVGVNWSRFGTKLVMAGEVFSESFRDWVARRVGASDPTTVTASLYGTADGGVLANETPATIRIRRALGERPELALELFGEPRLPTLCEFDPLHRYFEAVEGRLVFSGEGRVPLVRYDILDHGGVIPRAVMRRFLAENGLDAQRLFGHEASSLPFVYVFGRSSFAVSYYGANVYPENVALGVETPELMAFVTGKFVLEVVEDEALDARLRVTIELAEGGAPDAKLAADLARSIEHHLARVNSEFSHYVPAARRSIETMLLPHGDPSYFQKGVKHRYTRH